MKNVETRIEEKPIHHRKLEIVELEVEVSNAKLELLQCFEGTRLRDDSQGISMPGIISLGALFVEAEAP